MANFIIPSPFVGFITPPSSPDKIHQVSPSCRSKSQSPAYKVPNFPMIEVMPLAFPNLAPSPSPSKRTKLFELTEVKLGSNLFESSQKTDGISTIQFEKKETAKETVKKEVKKHPPKKGSSINFKSPILFDDGNGTSTLIVSTMGPFLSKKDQEEKKTVTLTLIPVGEGNSHKCWKASFNGKTYAIKTFKGNINIIDKTTAYKDTLAAYKLLQTRNDVSIVNWYNQEAMPTDGFYIYDFVDGGDPAYTDAIRNFFIKMILDHSLLLEDFTPANIRLVGEKIVIIDPYFSHDLDCPEGIIARNIKSWFKSNLDELPLEIKKIDALMQDQIISPVALEKWKAAKEILENLNS